jgi:rhomboid protease GluP
MPKCLKCGAELPVDEEGHAPVLCDRCAGRASSRAHRNLQLGAFLNYPATTLLFVINVGVFLAMPLFGVNPLSPSGEGLIRFGGNYGPLTLGGEYWRLVTAGFVHAGILHIAMNMWCLLYLGRMAERLFGKWQTLAIYLLTGVGGALLTNAYAPEKISVGASGALFGIAGALIAGLKFGDLKISWREQRATLSSVVFFAIFSFVWGMRSANTDNMCHLGGFVSGLLIGLPLGAFARKHKLLQLATIVATAGVLVVAAKQLVETQGIEGLVLRAEWELEQKNYPRAIQILEKYTAAQPGDYHSLLMLGDAYLLNNQRDKAAATYQQVLKLNPNSTDAQEALEELSGASAPHK